jgi:hypothetical protein
MLWKLRRHARPLLRPLLALTVLLWLATALAPCFASTPHCDGMDGAMPYAHGRATTDCDTACLQNDSRNIVVAILNAPAFAPLLLAMAALVLRPSVASRSIFLTLRRAPDTPLHLQFARLLI